MIALLLDIYLLFVWLIFFRFKLFPFTLAAKITVGVIGAVFVFGLLIVVNFLHPQSMDARVLQHVIQVATRTSAPARVTEVRVAPNVPVKKGEVLFVLDARPFEQEVTRLEAALAEAEQAVPQLKAALDAAVATVSKGEARLKLAQEEEARNRRLVGTGGVSREDYEESVRNLGVAQQAIKEATALAEKARLAYEAKTPAGENVTVAQTKAQLAKARIDLEETVVKAPANGFVTNLQLQPGFVVRPGDPVISFVRDPEGVVAVSFPQEYLGTIAVGNDVEVCLDTLPGRTLHGKVEAVILASGAGQLTPTGELPIATQTAAAARFPVKVRIDPADAQRYQLPAGAHGAAAVYTDYGKSMRVIRKVVLRWYTWLNYVKISM